MAFPDRLFHHVAYHVFNGDGQIVGFFAVIGRNSQGIFNGAPLGVENNLLCAVAHVARKDVLVAALVAVAGAVGLSVPAGEGVVLAGGLAGLNDCVVGVGEVVHRAAFAAVCVIFDGVGYLEYLDGLGQFGRSLLIGRDNSAVIFLSGGHNTLVLAGIGHIAFQIQHRVVLSLKEFAVLVPLVAVNKLLVVIFLDKADSENTAGIRGPVVYVAISNVFAGGSKRDLYIGGLNGAVLEQGVIPCGGHHRALVDLGFRHGAVFINQIPAAVLEAVNVACGGQRAVFAVKGDGDRLNSVAAVGVKGNIVSVCAPCRGVGDVGSDRILKLGFPAGESVAGALRRALKGGRCSIDFSHGVNLISKDFLIGNAVRVDNLAGGGIKVYSGGLLRRNAAVHGLVVGIACASK